MVQEPQSNNIIRVCTNHEEEGVVKKTKMVYNDAYIQTMLTNT
jgi:hypothetical protein